MAPCRELIIYQDRHLSNDNMGQTLSAKKNTVRILLRVQKREKSHLDRRIRERFMEKGTSELDFNR